MNEPKAPPAPTIAWVSFVETQERFTKSAGLGAGTQVRMVHAADGVTITEDAIGVVIQSSEGRDRVPWAAVKRVRYR